MTGWVEAGLPRSRHEILSREMWDDLSFQDSTSTPKSWIRGEKSSIESFPWDVVKQRVPMPVDTSDVEKNFVKRIEKDGWQTNLKVFAVTPKPVIQICRREEVSQ